MKFIKKLFKNTFNSADRMENTKQISRPPRRHSNFFFLFLFLSFFQSILLPPTENHVILWMELSTSYDFLFEKHFIEWLRITSNVYEW